MTLFADDVSLISSHHNKLVAEKELQRAVTAVADWGASKKMVLNAGKCEVTFFSTNFHGANCQPPIIANYTRLHHSSLPKFLGVTLDRLLTFGPHIQSISTKAAAHLGGVRVEKRPADKSLQSSAAQPPNLRGSS